MKNKLKIFYQTSSKKFQRVSQVVLNSNIKIKLISVTSFSVHIISATIVSPVLSTIILRSFYILHVFYVQCKMNKLLKQWLIQSTILRAIIPKIFENVELFVSFAQALRNLPWREGGIQKISIFFRLSHSKMH